MKRNFRLKLLLAGIALIVSGCAHAESEGMPSKITLQAEFPAPWMEQIIYAYEDFKATHDDMSCFSIWAYQEGDSYFVSIAPSDGVEIEGDAINIPVAGASPCGRGAKYEFDSSGKFVRRIGIR